MMQWSNHRSIPFIMQAGAGRAALMAKSTTGRFDFGCDAGYAQRNPIPFLDPEIPSPWT